MGWWTEQVVPRVTRVALSPKRTGEIRARVCAGLSGRVLELGFGSGPNAAYYPAGLTELLVVEPSDTGWRLSRGRRAGITAPVTRVGLDGQLLPLTDGSVDAAVSTWTLCSIPDAGAALAELRRVLRPGGRLHFVEHGLAPDEGVVRWQRRLEPAQRRLFAGCHLTRPIDRLLLDAGFALDRLDRYYEPREPKAFGSLYEGVAVSG